MCDNIVPSIETFPVELLHRIFDHLDVETILLSIRPVCRLFRSVTNTYNRYILDFNLISKSDFYLRCQVINPENVISLTLTNDDGTSNQIDLFISLVRLRHFTCLRSLALHNIDESQLNFILKGVSLKLLISFSTSIKTYFGTLQERTKNLLSSVIAQSTLRKVDLSQKHATMRGISWPSDCTIQYLTIKNHILINTFSKILQRSPHLHTLIMNNIPTGTINNFISMRFRQLTSLSMVELYVTIDELEPFLLLTPSLTYLKLLGGRKMLNGKRWEQFVETNLPRLKTFEFYFKESRSTEPTQIDLELIISSFQTLFWIEQKKWFVTCQYKLKCAHTIYLYSIPICKSFLTYEIDPQKSSVHTYPTTKDIDPSMMNRINSLRLEWNKSTANAIQEKKAITNQPLFPEVTEVEIKIGEDCSSSSLQLISVVIDISRIVRMKINTTYINQYDQNKWKHIGMFIKQAYNVSSLIIEGTFKTYELEDTEPILSPSIRHLEIPIDDLNQINMIFERYQNLSTIKFTIQNSQLSKTVINWFADNTINTTCQEYYNKVALWLGKKRIYSTGTMIEHKRIKLTENNGSNSIPVTK